MPRTRSISRVLDAGGTDGVAALAPRDDLVAETAAGAGRFVQRAGPFNEYERTVADGRETIRYRLDIPWFGWLFAFPMRHALRHPRPAGSPQPWWAPPDRLTPRQARLMGLLA